MSVEKETADTLDSLTAERRELRDALEAVEVALTDEDEIEHGEAWDDDRKRGRGFCAYCGMKWPCRTQEAIDRLLVKVRAALSEGGSK